MAKERIFKCAFSHCEHDAKKIQASEAVKIGNRYWHRDCYEISQIIQSIIDEYMNHFSQTVVISILRKIVNNIIFGKKLLNDKVPKYESDLNAARYLDFAIQFALDHNIPISHPQGLYYLIDNSRVKEAWKKKQEAEAQREVNREVAKNVDISKSEQTSFEVKQNTNIGFGDIFGNIFD